MNDVKYYFEFPFTCDQTNIYDGSGEIVASYYGLQQDFLRIATAKINGEILNFSPGYEYDRNKKIVRLGAKPMLYIKGATYLILNYKLDHETAEKVLHSLGEFITFQLNRTC